MAELTRKRTKQEIHLPKSFRHIRLELAREPGHPAGDKNFGYLIWAPLDDTGKIDAGLWKEYRDYFRVVKFRPGQDKEIGHLKHKHSGWTFHYDIAGADEDESGFHLESEHFVPGEYISIREGTQMHVYKVITVEHY